MFSTPSLRPLYSFSGWVMKDLKLDQEIALIELQRDKRLSLYCPDCLEKTKENRRVWQSVKDLPLATANLVILKYEAIQVRCTKCRSYSTILPPGIDQNAKATSRLIKYVSKLCRFMPANKIPEFIPISESTALRWDKKNLTETIKEPDLNSLRVLLVDEKSIGKHHNYMTVVMNGDTGDVLHLAEGKKSESLSSFFQKLTEKQMASIEAVGIDRAGAYKSVIKEYLPKAAIVFDKFHLVANCNKAVDEVRRAEWNKADKSNKQVIKGQRYNLLKNKGNLKTYQRVNLKELLDLNEPLFEAYLLKDAFKKVWNYKYKKSASDYLDRWIFWAQESMLKPFVSFANGVNRDRNEILSFIKHRITSARLEAFNATIGRIIKRACGYRDLDYLYLKIRQEALRSSQT